MVVLGRAWFHRRSISAVTEQPLIRASSVVRRCAFPVRGVEFGKREIV